MTSRPPLLLLDVDGALNPFAAPACPPGYTEHDFFPGAFGGTVLLIGARS